MCMHVHACIRVCVWSEGVNLHVHPIPHLRPRPLMLLLDTSPDAAGRQNSVSLPSFCPWRRDLNFFSNGMEFNGKGQCHPKGFLGWSQGKPHLTKCVLDWPCKGNACLFLRFCLFYLDFWVGKPSAVGSWVVWFQRCSPYAGLASPVLEWDQASYSKSSDLISTIT
jgi:hypothetical protein